MPTYHRFSRRYVPEMKTMSLKETRLSWSTPSAARNWSLRRGFCGGMRLAPEWYNPKELEKLRPYLVAADLVGTINQNAVAQLSI